jgi:hypothetical protein
MLKVGRLRKDIIFLKSKSLRRELVKKKLILNIYL